MSTDQPIRLTLPPHLIEKIRAILVYDIAKQLDEALKAELEDAIEAVRTGDALAAGRVIAPCLPTPSAEVTSSTNIGEAGSVDDRPVESDVGQASGQDPPAPPTIPEETLVRVARWAETKVGRGILKRYSLDAGDYSLISLLAGAQVYIPPSRLARLKAAETVDKPNPYLPTYLSPQPPSLGHEFSSLTKQLTTTLNVLFSIFGSAFAVYVAGTTGAGYSRETSILLGVLAGAVVGIAEAVLVWIFSNRVKEGRKERWERGVRMGRGTAGLGPKVQAIEGAEQPDADGEKRSLEAEPVDGASSGRGIVTEGIQGDPDNDRDGERPGEEKATGGSQESDARTSAVEQPKPIRLRRKPLGSAS